MSTERHAEIDKMAEAAHREGREMAQQALDAISAKWAGLSGLTHRFGGIVKQRN